MEYWKGMPEYKYIEHDGKRVTIHFKNDDDIKIFEKMIGQNIDGKRSMTFSDNKEKKLSKDVTMYLHSSNDAILIPKYPIYIVSKGRSYNPLTAKMLDKMGCPYKIVIEKEEYDDYFNAIGDKDKILILPFSNLGQGSIPARNWIWEHSISLGYERHWIFDDNISRIYRANNNKRHIADTPNIIKAAEEFIDRYTNVALAGFNYTGFGSQKSKYYVPPILLNTRIYSMILIKNDLPFRWRGRYNEDTDLSLRVLKDGLCTILFQAFLIAKMQTLTMKGGNTDELYVDDGRLKMAESLTEQHPDVCSVTKKWNRYQHYVNYEPFKKNKLILRDDININDGNNEYGMVLKNIPRNTLNERGIGYSWCESKKYYRARIYANGKCIYLGSFKNEKDAIDAVAKGRKNNKIVSRDNININNNEYDSSAQKNVPLDNIKLKNAEKREERLRKRGEEITEKRGGKKEGKGYDWCESRKYYRARIYANGKCIYLGSFKNEKDAITAVEEGRKNNRKI